MFGFCQLLTVRRIQQTLTLFDPLVGGLLQNVGRMHIFPESHTLFAMNATESFALGWRRFQVLFMNSVQYATWRRSISWPSHVSSIAYSWNLSTRMGQSQASPCGSRSGHCRFGRPCCVHGGDNSCWNVGGGGGCADTAEEAEESRATGEVQTP